MEYLYTKTDEIRNILDKWVSYLHSRKSESVRFRVKLNVIDIYLSIVIYRNRDTTVFFETALLQKNKDDNFNVIYNESVGYEDVNYHNTEEDVIGEIKRLKQFFSSSDSDEK